MNIIRLHYKNYRNLAEYSIAPQNGINVIYGKNAQGKTNLLEAIWLFTGGRSFRGSKDGELTQIGENTATLSLIFYSEEREQSAQISIQNGQRSAVINGIEKKSASALIGKFCAVIFSPEHLSLVKSGPALRRGFIDAAVCQIKPSYAKMLYQYNRTLTQRNMLLKDIPRHSELLDTLEIWDEKLSEYGSAITAERAWYVNKISEAAQEIYEGISKGQEKLNVSYLSTVFEIAENTEIFKIDQSDFRKNLKTVLKDDLSAGYTTIGPHRDDMQITLNRLSARAFGSQGQQRSAVLALKLAESHLLAEKTGEAPIILLDDVLSELDSDRQDYLLNHLENRQVFITCCEPESIQNLANGAMFHMQNGKISE